MGAGRRRGVPHKSGRQRRLGVLARQLGYGSSAVVSVAAAAAAAEESIPYLIRSHGLNFTLPAIQALYDRGPVDLGPASRWHAPVAVYSPKVLDFTNGVEASGYVDGETAVGKWNEVRDGMYDLPSQASDARSLHMGTDLLP